MISFYETGSLWQIILLILSIIAMMSLIGCMIINFRSRNSIRKLVEIFFVLMVNAILYVIMQVDSRITGADQPLPLKIPYIVFLVAVSMSLAYAVDIILRETKNRDTINTTSIKEAFDNLPAGICFFNSEGLSVLCNRAMHRFAFEVCGHDVQYITDLQKCMEKDFIPMEGVTKQGKAFIFPDGKVYQLDNRVDTYKDEGEYTEFIVMDITDLHRKSIELTDETNQLRRAQEELKRLSANVVAITREEEILNTKIRVHDEMGRCLIEARKYLSENDNEDIPESVVKSWSRAVSMLKYNNEPEDEDMLSQIRQTCEAVGLTFKQTGELPKDEEAAYILTCAVRECLTNAVRYAGANELYADFSESESFAQVSITNNGKQPDNEIIEGGGLSNLRRRVERAGGTMIVKSNPRFRLTVTLAKRKEGVLW